ncbi:MAG: universal stress protein [Alphaproteobacteria bacterium]
MTKILVCIDGSMYADNICTNAAWAAKRLGAEVDLLHVLRRTSDYQAAGDDHTGAIGIYARSSLMDELTKVDEERGKLDQQKGRIILAHGEKVLKAEGIENVNIIHRRGSLSETVRELEADVDMIFIGKRGEQANMLSEFVGSNLEKVARLIHKPLFVASRFMRPIKRFLISYDGKENARKAVTFAVQSSLLKGLECHLVTVEQSQHIDASEALSELTTAGFDVNHSNIKADQIDQAVSGYVTEHEIDLLLTGSYSHSVMRGMLLGSTTTSLIKACHVPLILFR